MYGQIRSSAMMVDYHKAKSVDVSLVSCLCEADDSNGGRKMVAVNKSVLGVHRRIC